MLEFHLSTILWTVINLLVLYLFLRKFLFGRINAVLEKREAMVKQNLDAAEESNQQAQAFKTKYEEKLTGAMQEADRIMAEAQNRRSAPMRPALPRQRKMPNRCARKRKNKWTQNARRCWRAHGRKWRRWRCWQQPKWHSGLWMGKTNRHLLTRFWQKWGSGHDRTRPPVCQSAL